MRLNLEIRKCFVLDNRYPSMENEINTNFPIADFKENNWTRDALKSLYIRKNYPEWYCEKTGYIWTDSERKSKEIKKHLEIFLNKNEYLFRKKVLEKEKELKNDKI